MASRADATPNGAAERHFRIGGQFYASVRERGSNSRQVLVGGVKRGCVTVDVNLARQPPEGVLNVSYDQRCNATGTLPRGVGTIAMLRAALAFTFRQFPELAAVYFKDQSYVVCTPGRRYAIAPQNLALYGKTWYERVIGAVPDDARDARRLRAFAEHCLASPPPGSRAKPARARRRPAPGPRLRRAGALAARVLQRFRARRRVVPRNRLPRGPRRRARRRARRRRAARRAAGARGDRRAPRAQTHARVGRAGARTNRASAPLSI